MTRQEAREILLLYRPGFSDSDDEDFGQALEVAKQDPELAAWFEQHCSVQKTLATAFQQIEVAEGLKEQILSERKAHFSKRARRTAVAVCAVLAIAGALFVIVPQFLPPSKPDDSFANFRDRMSGEVQRLYPPMDLVTNNLQVVQNFLAEKGRPGIAVPPPLAETSTMGCRVFTWQGKPVSMICFNSGKAASPTNPDLFLFVVQRSDFQAASAASAPQLSKVKGLNTATWSDGDKVYLLGGFGDEAFLKKYL